MFDSISGVSALTAVSGVSGASSPGAGLSALQANGADAARQPDLGRLAQLGGAEGVGAAGPTSMPAALRQPLPLSFLNGAEGGPSVTDLVQMQMGLMNYSMSLSIMTQTHKKISESKSALMNEGKNA